MGLLSSLAGLVGSNRVGKVQERAAIDAANAQKLSIQQAIDEAKASGATTKAYFDPYAKVGTDNLSGYQQMLTPEGQAAYLGNNPLFKAALGETNRMTGIAAAIRGRSAAGDTEATYLRNWQATALPFLQNQQSQLFNAVNFGYGAAGNQANINDVLSQRIGGYLTDQGSAESAGIIGKANAKAAKYKGYVQGISSMEDEINKAASGLGKMFGIGG